MRRRSLLAVAVGALLLLGACSSSDDDPASSTTGGDSPSTETAALTLEAVSTRPDYVTGGDVLLALTGDGMADAVLHVDGEAVEVDWQEDGTRMLGLLSGLTEGDHEVVASTGGEEAGLTVTNNPVAGPLFAGPHLPMPTCSTETFGLGPPVDDDCSAAQPVVSWSYVNAAGERVPLADPTDVPSDAAMLDDGETPFVLREEKGTLDRAVYWITVVDPAPNPDDVAAWDPAAWNGRLVYEYGGGCGVTYSQGFKLLGPADLEVLKAGYAHATSTLNTFQVTCNAVQSAEATMVVKEHFSEQYGLPELTIGTGGSGGAIQQYQIVQNYPGLLDAAATLLPFPDAVSIAGDVVDCGLLERFYRTHADTWTDDEKRSVTGHSSAGTCRFWESTFAQNVDPAAGCSLELLSAASDSIDALADGLPEGTDPSLAYDAESNPDGLRCTLQDGNINMLPTDPDTGFAERPWDNVGVQYGLSALQDGSISVDQFLELNEHIGSFDIDGQWVDERAEATEASIVAAYETGMVNEGGGDLQRIPIIAVNLWTDDQGDIHTRDRAFAARERLGPPRDGEAPPNFMIWTRGLPDGDSLVDSLTGSVGLGLEVLGVLDQWATAVTGVVPDRDAASDAEMADVLERTRPEEAIDNCITADGERVMAVDLYDQDGPCTDPYPVSASPRVVAGAPLRNDILKCALRPVDDAIADDVYGKDLTDDQIEQLEEIFPDGICDWEAAGVGVAELQGVWQDFRDP